MSHCFPSARWLAAGGAVLSLLAPGAAQAAQGEIGCANVDVIVVRGSAGPAGSSIALDAGTNINSETGVWSMIRKELQTPTDGSTPISQIVTPNASGQVVRTDVEYPADLPFPSSGQGDVADSAVFRNSVRYGTQRVIEYLNQQYLRCPYKRYVLLGYSQGAVVVGNAMTDNVTQRLWISSDPLPALNPSAKSMVTAVELFADVGFRQDLGWTVHSGSLFGTQAAPYLQGTADDLTRGINDGNSSHITTAPAVRAFNAWDASTKLKVRDYCIKDDFICQGTGGLAEHLYYGDAAKPAPRRNLAIHAVQKLRNQFDKTLTAQCTATVTSTGALEGTQFTAKFRFQGSITDRGTPGGSTSITNTRATFSVDGANATTLRAILGDASATNLSLPSLSLSGVSTDAAGSASPAVPVSWGASDSTTTPLTSGSPWSASIASSTASTWTLGASGGRLDLSMSAPVLIVRGTNGKVARNECTIPSTQQFSTLGRVVVG